MFLLAGGGTAWAAEHHPAKAPQKADRVVVQLATVAKFGKVLVDQNDFALYYDSADKPHHFACVGACLTVWPPLVLPKGQAKPIAGKGVSGLGVVKGPSGEQVTWHGKPLYTFVRDGKGTVRGEGIKQDGTWFVAQVAKPPASSPKPAAKTTKTTKPATSHWA